jgi:hypothetical protein
MITMSPVVSPVGQRTILATMLVVAAAFRGGHDLNMDFLKVHIEIPSSGVGRTWFEYGF